MLNTQFNTWTLTNYKPAYNHLKKPGATIRVASDTTTASDQRMMMACNTFGKLKTQDEVMRTGQRMFNNGGGCCTTSAFAAAYKLMAMGLGTDAYPGTRVEIVGQGGGTANGHSWVIVNRLGGMLKGKKGYRIANNPNTWGNFLAVDPWLMAFGWEGVWFSPPNGEHHFFINSSKEELELVFDSNYPNGI